MFSIKMSVCVCSPLVCYCCHASQHLGSTVTLAWDFLVSLCVCWAIYSESGTEPDVYLIHLYRSVLQLLHMPGFPSFSAPTESSCHKTFSPRMTREGGGDRRDFIELGQEMVTSGGKRQPGITTDLQCCYLITLPALPVCFSLCRRNSPTRKWRLCAGTEQEHEWNEEARYKLYSK